MARQIYNIKQKIENLLNADPLINSVFRGQDDDFLRQKKNFYPSARVDYGPASITNEAITVTMLVQIVGQVDDAFENEDNVLNDAMTSAARLVAQLQEADHDAEFEQVEPVTSDYIWEANDSNVAGFGLTIPLTMANTSHENS